MKSVVVYDSEYGNTKAIAKAIGDALPGEVQVLAVGEVNPGDLGTADLPDRRLAYPEAAANRGSNQLSEEHSAERAEGCQGRCL